MDVVFAFWKLLFFFKLKKKKFLRGNETAANEPTMKMWLPNSYLAFIFVFHFSKSRQRYFNLVCTKRKKERKKEGLVKFQKTEFAAINIFQIFY